MRDACSKNPSSNPSEDPSQNLSTDPSEDPSEIPSSDPPSKDPSENPSTNPSEDPSEKPSIDPSEDPSETQSRMPTALSTPSPAQGTSPAPTNKNCIDTVTLARRQLNNTSQPIIDGKINQTGDGWGESIMDWYGLEYTAPHIFFGYTTVRIWSSVRK